MDVSITIPAQTITIPEETVSVTIPVAGIVYQNSWLNQNSNIPTTDIFTPSGEGLFRVTVGIFSNGPGNGGSGGNVYYPGPGTSSFSSTFNTGSNPEQYTVPVSMVFGGTSGVSLTIETNTTVNYDLFVTVEQLQ